LRRTEFHRAVSDEFGVRGDSLVADLVLPGLDGLTAREAMAGGVAPREIWFALCDATDVPLERRHGAGRLEPRGR
jgi:hypothetical protein